MQETESTSFLREIEHDERVIQSAVIAMADKDQLVAAIYRLSATREFPETLAELVLARRNGNTFEANRLCAEVLWSVEDAILEHVRKGVAP